MTAFDRLAPFIREYIYEQGWTDLRDVQVAACHTVFFTDHHLLLSSGTASGKTEAAFLPALTQLYEDPPASVGILYISPLKALINDQFERLSDLLKASGIPVCRWHGDASASGKRAVEADPRGVLQITPESLESLVMRKSDLCRVLFADTRFVIIDEVHAFMSSPRGSQLLCLLSRISRLTGVAPRRIGLSATLSDPDGAGEWLAMGTGRECDVPLCPGEKKRVRVKMDAFPKEDSAGMYHEAYRVTLGKKAILFANSRAGAEEAASCLQQEANRAHTPGVYQVHHGSLSAALRRDAEREMKQAEGSVVTCATLTLELGIDIGRLDTVVQIGAPATASSLVQRLGRCGRRGQAAELLFLFREEEEDIPWELIKGVAILELYRREKWTEPGRWDKMDMSLLFQQTLSLLYAGGEMKPSRLAREALTLPPFDQVDREDYATLLRDLISRGFIERTERGGLILGLEGERLCGHYDFFSAFEAREETEVRCGSDVLGTVTGEFQPGDTLRLAGRAWQVQEISEGKLYVIPAQTAQASAWQSLAGARLHPRLAAQMRHVLTSQEDYPYMTPRCRERLQKARRQAAAIARGWQAGQGVVNLYPFMGSDHLQALSLMLPGCGFSAEILPTRMTPIYIQVGADSQASLHRALWDIALGGGELQFADGFDFPGKYARYIPRELCEKAYARDQLDLTGMRAELKAYLEAAWPAP